MSQKQLKDAMDLINQEIKNNFKKVKDNAYKAYSSKNN